MITDPPKKVNIGEVVADPFGDGGSPEVAVGEVVADPFGDGGDEVVAAKEPPVIGTPPISQSHPDNGGMSLVLDERGQPKTWDPSTMYEVEQMQPGIAKDMAQKKVEQKEGLEKMDLFRTEFSGMDQQALDKRASATSKSIEGWVAEREKLKADVDAVKARAATIGKQRSEAELMAAQAQTPEEANQILSDFNTRVADLQNGIGSTLTRDKALSDKGRSLIRDAELAAMRDYDIRKEQGSWGGAAGLATTKGIGSMSSGVTSYLIDAMAAIAPKEMLSSDTSLTRDEIAKKAKGHMLEQIRTGVSDLARKEGAISTTDEYYQEAQKPIIGQALLGLTESVPAMLTPTMSGIFFQTSDAIGKEMEGAEWADTPEAEKAIIKTAVGVPAMLLERWGFRNLAKNSALTKSIAARALANLPRGATAGQVARVLDGETRSALTNFMSRGLGGAASEFETGAAQQAEEQLVRLAHNMRDSGPELKNPDTFFEAAAEVGLSGTLEAIGGGAMSLPYALRSAVLTGKVSESIDKKRWEMAESLLGDEDYEASFAKAAEADVLSGKVTRSQADKALDDLREAREIISKIPKDIDTDARQKAFDLLNEKRRLSKMDKNLVGDRVAAIDARLAFVAGHAGKTTKEKEEKLKKEVGLIADIARRKGLTEDETALAMASLGYLTVPEGASLKQNPDGSYSLKVKEAKEGEKGMTEEQVLKDLRSQLPPVAATEVSEAGDPVRSEATTVMESRAPVTTDSEGRPVHHTQEGVDNFNDWFGTSVVSDEQGRPLVQYHGTRGDFNEFLDTENTADHPFLVEGFSSLPHAGTLEQANDRNAMTGREGTKESVMPVYLSIKNPLRMNDLGGWGARTILRAVTGTELGVDPDNDLSPAALKKLEDLRDEIDEAMKPESPEEQDQTGMESIPRPKREAEWLGKIKDILEEDGYDGIVYHNMSEGMGAIHSGAKNDSYIPFSRKQIKSARGNSGAFDPNKGSVVASKPGPGAKKSSVKPNIKKIINALKGIAPGLNITQHADAASFAAAANEIGASPSAWGLYDPRTNSIHINPAAADTTQVTFHEAAHPLITALAKNNPELFVKFYDEVLKADPKYAEFASRYSEKSDIVQAAEAIVEFLGDVAAGHVQVSAKKDSLWQKMKAWLKDMLAAMGIDLRTIDMSKPSDVREFAAEFKRAMETGLRITGLPTASRAEDISLSKSKLQSDIDKSITSIEDKKVTVNERTALKDRLRGLAKAATDAYRYGKKEGFEAGEESGKEAGFKSGERVGEAMGTLAGEMHGKAAGRKEGSKESETHAGRARQVMTDAVKMAIDPIRGKLTPGQSRSLTSAVAKTDPTSITQINKLLDKIDSIVADANYADKLLDFKKLKGRIIAAAKSKKGESARLAEEFAKLDAEQADIDEHTKLGEDILKALRVVSKDGVAEPIDNGKLLDYINKQVDVQRQKQERDEHDELVDYALSGGGMDIPLERVKELRDQLEAAIAPAKKALKDMASEKSMDDLRAAAEKAQQDLKAHHPKNKEEAEVLSQLSKMDLGQLSKDQLKELIFTAGNIVRNNDYAGARLLASKTLAQEFITELDKETQKLGRPGTESKVLNSFDAIAIALEKIFRTPAKAAKYKMLMGLEATMNALSDARHRTEQKQARRNELAKKLKVEDSVLNRYRMGVYAYLIQNFGGDPAQRQSDFDIAAQNLRESINNLNASNTEERHKEHLRFYEQAVNEVLGDAKSVADLKIDTSLKAIVDSEIKEFSDAKPMHDRAASMDYAENPRVVSNYTPRRVKKLFGSERGPRKISELFEPSIVDQGVNPDMASAKMERSQKLPAGSAVDLDFFDVTDDSYQQNMEDSLGARHINVMREVFKSDALDRLMGRDTKEMLKTRIHGMLNSEEIARTGINTTSRLWRRFGRMSARIALSGVAQLPKQITVGASTLLALGKDAPLLFDSYGDAVQAMADDSSWQNKLMEGEQVHERGRVLGGVEKVGDAITRKAILSGDEKALAKYLKVKGHKIGVGADQVGYLFLKIGDVMSAQAAWFAYYKQHLKNKGVDLNDVEWKTNKDPEAAAYANQMVERSQNANTIPALPEVYRQQGGMKYFLDYAMSFSSFALNTKKRMARDIKMLWDGANEDKAFAARDLIGVTLEMILFNATAVGMGYAGKAFAETLIKGITGDEPEKDKKARGYWEKVFSRAMWDTVFGGLPDAPAYYPKQLINSLTHDKKKSDLFYVSKEANLGLFGPLVEQMGAFGTGAIDAVTKDSAEDKELAGMLAAIALMNLTVFSDQTFSIPFTREAQRKLKKKEKKGATLFPAP